MNDQSEKSVMIIGRGHLGNYLLTKFFGDPGIHWTKDMSEITDAVLDDIKPDVIINCAGKTDLPWCEENQAECFRCNVMEPVRIYKMANKRNITFIQLSSGCMFDGPFDENNKPFTSSSSPSPACYYTWSKLTCDLMLMEHQRLMRPPRKNLVILRPRQLYSPVNSPRNTLVKLMKYEKLLDTPNSMTSADTIYKTIQYILAHYIYVIPTVITVYDHGVSSPFKVGKLLADNGFRSMPTLLEKSDMDKWHKPKRVDTVVYDQWFEETLNPPDVDEEIIRVIKQMPQAT